MIWSDPWPSTMTSRVTASETDARWVELDETHPNVGQFYQFSAQPERTRASSSRLSRRPTVHKLCVGLVPLSLIYNKGFYGFHRCFLLVQQFQDVSGTF